MDVRDLAYLQAIIDAGTIVDAADRLGRTPPALTKAIRRLEAEVGCDLFVKSGRGIEPTEAASYLADQTRGIGRRLEKLRLEAKSLASGEGGLVKMGVSATMAAIYLPMLLRRLSNDIPNLRLSIVNGMNNVLLRGLHTAELDVVLGVYDRDDGDELDGFPIAKDEVRVTSAIGHSLSGRPLTLEELQGQRWVLPSRAVKVRQWLDATFMANDLEPPVPHVETNSIAILETLIADSDFISFVSNWKVGTRLVRNSLTALDAPKLKMRRDFGLLWSTFMPPRRATTLLIDYVKGMMAHEDTIALL